MILISQVDAVLRTAGHERAIALHALAALAVVLQYPMSLGYDSKQPDPRWQTLLFIELPTGQVSWHIHKDDLPLFDSLPQNQIIWDGHTREERDTRIQNHFTQCLLSSQTGTKSPTDIPR